MESIKKTSYCENESKTVGNIGILIFRVVLGVLMLTHGWQKLSNFEMMSSVFPDPIGLGTTVSLSLIIFAEFFCSILIIFGLFTRLATIPLMIGMIVAAFVVHANDPFAVKELSFLYLSLYVALAFIGGGKFSIDYLLRETYAKLCGKFRKSN
ncbi:MAG: DoxX family protein [Bacteroidales bacterium]|nr:DoxX family protein [Bacteroidales bacterium]